MADQEESRYRDEKGRLIGGTTAHAPGIHQGDDLQGLVDVTSAEEAASALGGRRVEGETATEPTAIAGLDAGGAGTEGYPPARGGS